MKRSPLQRGKPLARGSSQLRRTPMRRTRSSGRARADERLATWCEAAVVGVCTGRAEHRHHKRGRVGADVDESEHTVDLCDACHRHVHSHPLWSYEHGWMEHRL